MRSVSQRSARPSGSANVAEIAATASVAEVKIQAAGRAASAIRSSVAPTSKGTQPGRKSRAGSAQQARAVRRAAHRARRSSSPGECRRALGQLDRATRRRPSTRSASARSHSAATSARAAASSRGRPSPQVTRAPAAPAAATASRSAAAAASAAAPARARSRRFTQTELCTQRRARRSCSSCSTWRELNCAPKNCAARSGSWCASSRITASALGQDVAEAFFLQREVRQQQMVIDHDEVRFAGAPARGEHMAAREFRAAAAAAAVARRDVMRSRSGMAVAAVRCSSARSPSRVVHRPARDARAATTAAPPASGSSAGMPAADARGTGSCCDPSAARPLTARPSAAAEHRQVAVEELVLQRAGAGGDDARAGPTSSAGTR